MDSSRSRPCGTPRHPLFRIGEIASGAFFLLGLSTPSPGQEDEPRPVETVRLERAGTLITRSCRVEVPAAPIADSGNGVLRIVADGVTVELAGEPLQGAPGGTDPDRFQGVGIVIAARDVTLRNARVRGFRTGIHALAAHGLVLEDCDVSGNYRQRLRSTQAAEEKEDWLEPHANDGHEWFQRYGAGIYVERSSAVTVARCRARAGQNGLILERVERARVHDNDFSFLSGWGIALWRSCDNVIARNACDFCIRGYSHGVYNRGQDSAGILLFEQCSRNVIAENSATHCGDGLFAFAGQEALGASKSLPAGFDHARAGCNDNTIAGNDFSYAAAHGIEITFSFGNRLLSNRLVENSICGVWAGYSRETLIAANEIVANGRAGYGLERGGIDIEHGQRNVIQGNVFRSNACGVHLWWDEDAGLAALPWTAANGHEARGEIVAGNRFESDDLGIQLRATSDVVTFENRFVDVAKQIDATPGAEPREKRYEPVAFELPRDLPGETRPVGARTELRGRDKIRIEEWGPVEPR